MTSGKVKGGRFEREIGKALSLWITSGEKADCFWRSAMSGGRATVARNKGQLLRQHGDLTGVSEEGIEFLKNLYIECKHLREINVFGLITGKGDLISIWSYVNEEASKYSKAPVFIVRQNMRPTLLFTNVTGMYLMGFQPRLTLSDGTVIQLLDTILSKPYKPLDLAVIRSSVLPKVTTATMSKRVRI